MGRSALLVHDSATIRRVVKRFGRSELADVAFEHSANGAAALERLEGTRFDVVIAGTSFDDMDGAELRRGLRASGKNSDTPVLLVGGKNGAGASDDHDLLTRPLALPFSAAELAHAVNRACRPDARRAHARVAVPDLSVIVEAGGCRWTGEALNVGMGGTLCELDNSHEIATLLGRARVALDAPAEANGGPGERVVAQARFVRLEIASWTESGDPHRLRTAWRFERLEARDQERLESWVTVANTFPWNDED